MVRCIPPPSDRVKAGFSVQDFDNGAIYWTDKTGAWEVFGLIGNKYDSMGGPASALRWPVSGELSTPNGPARFNRFQTGNIYHSPAGTDAVYGGIFGEWARQGYENGRLGFPISDEFDVPLAVAWISNAAGSNGTPLRGNSPPGEALARVSADHRRRSFSECESSASAPGSMNPGLKRQWCYTRLELERYRKYSTRDCGRCTPGVSRNAELSLAMSRSRVTVQR
ncbi:LGFP repeat-containing protein [Nocardia gipuzkoensis]